MIPGAVPCHWGMIYKILYRSTMCATYQIAVILAKENLNVISQINSASICKPKYPHGHNIHKTKIPIVA
jgi:hypothetical protein